MSVLQAQAISVERSALQRRESITAYLINTINGFETGWQIHEQALLKYELNQAKLTNYEALRDEKGEVFWQHKKTGEKTFKNPGLKYFHHNKKAMRQRAEEKFQKDVVSRVEDERERLELKTEMERAAISQRVR